MFDSKTQNHYKELLSEGMIKDRFRLKKSLQKTFKEKDEKGLSKFLSSLDSSRQIAKNRQANIVSPVYPNNLPISEKLGELGAAIKAEQVIIVAGETGSGKSTQLPKLCFELGLGVYGRIAHTQPRRIAAKTLSSRVAQELLESSPDAKDLVACKVRFSDTETKDTQIKLMTDGMLLAEIQTDRFLEQYQAIIIDEAHERSLSIDFLLAYLKTILAKRKDLKVIITSATIDVEKFSRHFDEAPIIRVSGRSFPVEIEYINDFALNKAGDESEEEWGDRSLGEQVHFALKTIQKQKINPQANDVLVFLSGEKEIREVSKDLRKIYQERLDVLPLYGRLSLEEQNKIFSSSAGGRRRVVLATNVAETSVTVPNIGFVIDTGVARISRYSAKSKVQRLPIEAISQASANQRSGRCGRIAPGFCVRLYEEDEFITRPEFTEPEIQRTNLASVILKFESLGLKDFSQFPLLDRPDARLVNDAYALLDELKAFDNSKKIEQKNKRHLGEMGKAMASIPLDPRLARILIESNKRDCLNEALVIVSALSILDPRERPHQYAQSADSAHNAFKHPQSDFLSLYNLWVILESKRIEFSRAEFRNYCKSNFISVVRYFEWRELHRQLKNLSLEKKYKLNQNALEPCLDNNKGEWLKKPEYLERYSTIHQSLLSGLLSNVFTHDRGFEYRGVRNRKVFIFPASSLMKSNPKWAFSSELLETTKLYAHNCALIEKEWLEEAAKHLLKQSVFEPHWRKKEGRVVAYENLSLFGLNIVERRKIDFSGVDQELARELFIRQALVERNMGRGIEFVRINWEKIDEVEGIEQKLRKRDYLVDDEVIYQYYLEKIPNTISKESELKKWYAALDVDAQRDLVIDRNALLKALAPEDIDFEFPDQRIFNGVQLDLDYRFKPGDEEDGLAFEVRIDQLNQVSQEQLDWLVPGLLEQKCLALLKSLPKSIRRELVPLPETVEKVVEKIQFGEGSLTSALAFQLLRLKGLKISDQDWQLDRIPINLKAQIIVVDENGKNLDSDRDLELLKMRLKSRVKKELESINVKGGNTRDIEASFTDWEFGDLPEFEILLKKEGKGQIKIKTFPGIEDQGDSIRVRHYENIAEAERAILMGQRRLAYLKLADKKRYLKKNLKTDALSLKLLAGGDKDILFDDIFSLLIDHTFFYEPDRCEFGGVGRTVVRKQGQFQSILKEKQSNLVDNANSLIVILGEVANILGAIREKLNENVSATRLECYKNIKTHLDRLVYPGFLSKASFEVLERYPHYLRGMLTRIERLQGNIERDIRNHQEMERFWRRYIEYYNSGVNREISLGELRWQYEELCLATYSQGAKTILPISVKKLNKKFDSIVA